MISLYCKFITRNIKLAGLVVEKVVRSVSLFTKAILIIIVGIIHSISFIIHFNNLFCWFVVLIHFISQIIFKSQFINFSSIFAFNQAHDFIFSLHYPYSSAIHVNLFLWSIIILLNLKSIDFFKLVFIRSNFYLISVIEFHFSIYLSRPFIIQIN